MFLAEHVNDLIKLKQTKQKKNKKGKNKEEKIVENNEKKEFSSHISGVAMFATVHCASGI